MQNGRGAGSKGNLAVVIRARASSLSRRGVTLHRRLTGAWSLLNKSVHLAVNSPPTARIVGCCERKDQPFLTSARVGSTISITELLPAFRILGDDTNAKSASTAMIVTARRSSRFPA